jgi:hypothetical protein
LVAVRGVLRAGYRAAALCTERPGTASRGREHHQPENKEDGDATIARLRPSVKQRTDTSNSLPPQSGELQGLGLNFPTYGGVREGSLHASAGKVYVLSGTYLRFFADKEWFLLILAQYKRVSKCIVKRFAAYATRRDRPMRHASVPHPGGRGRFDPDPGAPRKEDGGGETL